jgi:predicted Zn-dependent protease
MYLQLATLSSKTGNADDARKKLERVTQLSPKDAYAWYLLGQNYFGEYEKLNTETKTLQGQAKADATAKAFAKLDQVIDYYARAVGLSAGKDGQKDLYEPLLKDLTSIYDFRNGSKAGLDQLIAKYKQ